MDELGEERGCVQKMRWVESVISEETLFQAVKICMYAYRMWSWSDVEILDVR